MSESRIRSGEPARQGDRQLARAVQNLFEQLEERRFLDSSDIQALPFELDFSSSHEGSLVDSNDLGTGFTRVQSNKNGTQYQPPLIDLDTAIGVLKLTTDGSASAVNNSGLTNTLVNGLETQFTGNSTGFIIEARLVGPFGFLDANDRQAGIFFGPNQDNFAKLVLVKNEFGQRLEFSDEYSQSSTSLYNTRSGSNAQTNVGSFSSINTLDLQLVGDPNSGTVQAWYRINANSGDFTRLAYHITVPSEKRAAFFNSASRTGVMVTQQPGGSAITATFDSFSIRANSLSLATPSVISTEPSGGSINASRAGLVLAEVSLPNSGSSIDVTTLAAGVKLIRASDSSVVDGNVTVIGSGTTIQFQSNTTLDANASYTFQINSNLKDTAGASFSDYGASFITAQSGLSVDKTQFYFSDVSATVTGGSGPGLAQTLRISNTGTTTLTLDANSFNFSSAQFAFGSPINLPLDLEPGAFVDVQLAFNAIFTDTIVPGTLTITPTSENETPVSVSLRGLGTRGTGGALEPSLQRLMQLFEIPITVGDPDPSTFDIPSPPNTPNDELAISQFVKAGSGPVTIDVLGNFANSVSPSSRFGYYEPGTIARRTELFNVGQVYAQTVMPLVTGSTSFDPTGAFALYGEFPAFVGRVVASEASLNSWESNPARRQKVRFYPLKNPDGNIVSNAYIFTFEEYTVSFDQNDLIGIIRNVTPVGAGAELGYLNVDGNIAGATNRLVFSRITNLAVADPDTGQIPNTVHDRSVLRLINTGTSTLSVTNLLISSSDFVIESIKPTGSSSTLTAPFTIAAGSSVDVTIKFVYTRSGNGNEKREATLTLYTDDSDEPTKTFSLAGLWQSHSEHAPSYGSVESSAKRIIEVFGFGIDIGNYYLVSDSQVTHQGNNSVAPSWVANVTRSGEEVFSTSWMRAELSKPSSARMLAAFHQQKTTANSQLRYADPSASSGGTFLFRHRASDGQTFLPLLDNGNPAFAEFSPTAAFELRVDSHWSNPAKNEYSVNPAAFPYNDSGHAMRFFAAKDSDGNVIPNTYIMIQDYTGQSFSNFDYQDNIYLFTNIRPVTGPTTVIGLNAVASSSGIVLSWSANTEGNLAGYNIYRSTTSNGTYELLDASPTQLTSFTDTAALVGQQYFYRVRALDLHGTESDAGSTVNATRATDDVAPSAPSYPTAIGSTAGIALNWLDNSEPDLAGYNVFRSSSLNGTYTQINESVIIESNYLDTTATPGATSYYRIVAIDLTGNVSAAAQTNAMRPANTNVPVAPSNLAAQAISSSAINLTWADNSSNETGFVLERRTLESSTFETLVTLPANTTSYTNSGLSEDTTYIYRVRAINNSGTSIYSNEVAATTLVSLPIAPIGLESVIISKSIIKLGWFDNAANESGYRIDRRTESGPWTQIATVGAGVTRFIDGSASPNTTYSYRVRAFNAGGDSDYSNSSSATTPARAETFASADIGAPLAAGSTHVVTSGRDYTITAGGTDIWNRADQFRFVYRQITGDFDYSVRISGLTQADARSMAGLMARETLEASSKNAFMRVRADDTARFAWRNSTGGTSSATGISIGAAVAQFVRLTRSGDVFSGYFSGDGVTWTLIGSTTISMSATIHLGLAASARSMSQATTTATFTDLSDRLAASTPSAPADVSAIVDPSPRVMLNWHDTSSNETGFRIERQLESSAWQTIATLPSDRNSYTDTALSLDSTYNYRVIAFNSAGDSPTSAPLMVAITNGIPDAPNSLTSTLNGMSVQLAWADHSSDEAGFEIQRRYAADSNWQTIAMVGAGETSYTDANPSINAKYDYRVRAIGTVADSAFSNTTTITTPSRDLSPSNVGESSGSTSTVTTNVSYNLTGSGAEIDNRRDHFRYLRRQLFGDFDVSVKIESITAASSNAMAGLMIRESLEASSRNVFVRIKKDGSLHTTYRSSTGGNTTVVSGGQATFPNVYLRVVRKGSIFTTYSSADGFNWTTLARVTMSLPQKLYVGMSVASHSPTGKATARFRDFVVV